MLEKKSGAAARITIKHRCSAVVGETRGIFLTFSLPILKYYKIIHYKLYKLKTHTAINYKLNQSVPRKKQK